MDGTRRLQVNLKTKQRPLKSAFEFSVDFARIETFLEEYVFIQTTLWGKDPQKDSTYCVVIARVVNHDGCTICPPPHPPSSPFTSFFTRSTRPYLNGTSSSDGSLMKSCFLSAILGPLKTTDNLSRGTDRSTTEEPK